MGILTLAAEILIIGFSLASGFLEHEGLKIWYCNLLDKYITNRKKFSKVFDSFVVATSGNICKVLQTR